MRRIVFQILSIFILFLCLTAIPAVQAQAGSAQDLIAAVNAVRANHGLAPYVVDGGLMEFAQQHSEYQASIGKITHTRADGSEPADHGVFENIGGGPNASVSIVVNNQWANYWHQHTMIGFTEGYVGAGVAVVDGMAYYTLVVRRTGGFTTIQPPAAPVDAGTPAAPGQAAPTGDPVQAVGTAAPQEDGSVVHPVAPGQTLWSIATAYNTTLDELAALNGLDPKDPVIYAGQEIIIQPAYTPTPTPEPTGTTTPTPTATATRRPTRTPRPELDPTAGTALTGQVSGLASDGRALAIGITILCGLGLLALVTFKMKDKA